MKTFKTTYTSNKPLYKDLGILLAVTTLITGAFIYFDFFEWWYEYTRAHEEWELDELFSFFFALMIAGSIMAICKILALRRAMKILIRHEEVELRRKKLIALGSLAGGLAHELNNTLQPTIGLGDFVMDELRKNGSDKHLSYMRTIMGSAQHAKEIIDNVLLISHEKSLATEELDVNEAFPAALQLSMDIIPKTIKFQQSGIFSDTNTTQDKFIIIGNRTGLFQIFYNLFKNACDAMDSQGEIDIDCQISQMPSKSSERSICIKIRDQGHGMEAGTMEEIFDPFFTTKDHSEGTGLGLSSVHALVSEHGGEIEVESTAGIGTCFTVHLPVEQKGKDNTDG